MRLNLGNEKYLYFSTFPDYTLADGQFSLNGFFALKINIQQDRFVSVRIFRFFFDEFVFSLSEVRNRRIE